jgi:hypothetical protein
MISCSGMYKTERIERINQASKNGIDTRDDFVKKFGAPDLEYKDIAKNNCIAYVGVWQDYCSFCFNNSGVNNSSSHGKKFTMPDTTEYFIESDSLSISKMFLKHYENKFGVDSILDNRIRVYILPSFSKEIFIEFDLKRKTSIVLAPRDSMLWSEMQEKTNYGGRVKNESELSASTQIVQLAPSKEIEMLFNFLIHSNVTEMKSIRKNAFFFDGTSFVYESKINGNYNNFEIRNIPWYNKLYDELNRLTEGAYEGYIIRK